LPGPLSDHLAVLEASQTLSYTPSRWLDGTTEAITRPYGGSAKNEIPMESGNCFRAIFVYFAEVKAGKENDSEFLQAERIRIALILFTLYQVSA